jgi:hypothetical protein
VSGCFLRTRRVSVQTVDFRSVDEMSAPELVLHPSVSDRIDDFIQSCGLTTSVGTLCPHRAHTFPGVTDNWR